MGVDGQYPAVNLWNDHAPGFISLIDPSHWCIGFGRWIAHQNILGNSAATVVGGQRLAGDEDRSIAVNNEVAGPCTCICHGLGAGPLSRAAGCEYENFPLREAVGD